MLSLVDPRTVYRAKKKDDIMCVFASLLCKLYIILYMNVYTHSMLTKHPRNPAVTRIFIHIQYSLTTSRNVAGRAKGLVSRLDPTIWYNNLSGGLQQPPAIINVISNYPWFAWLFLHRHSCMWQYWQMICALVCKISGAYFFALNSINRRTEHLLCCSLRHQEM